MFEKLLTLSKKSDSKYSNFSVSSILVFDDGSEIGGVNVESATYGATTCAERNSISFAIVSGKDLKKVKEIHILGYNSKSKNSKENDFFISPCGICRQIMNEKLNSDVKVILYNFYTKESKIFVNKDLLPNFFSGENILDK